MNAPVIPQFLRRLFKRREFKFTPLGHSPENLRPPFRQTFSHRDSPPHSHRFFRLYWVALPTAMAVLVLGGWGTLQLWRARWGGKAQTEAVLTLGIIDHVQCVLKSRIAMQVYTPERMALTMGPEYVGLVSLLEKMLSRDFQVTAAHRCSVDGRHFVHLVIRNQDQVLSLVVTRKGGYDFPRWSPADGVDLLGMPLYIAHLMNLEVAGFETSDHLGFVVSGLDRKTNLQLASDLAPPLRDFLRKIE